MSDKIKWEIVSFTKEQRHDKTVWPLVQLVEFLNDYQIVTWKPVGELTGATFEIIYLLPQ